MEEKQKSSLSPLCIGDWVVLYLRIIVGGALLLHNVAKMQNYNFIIESYHQMWGVGGATWYVLFALVEVVCAFLLIIGRWVRSAAMVLIIGTLAGMIIYFEISSPTSIELNALYIFIYLLFVITGGGFYSFDATQCRALIRRRRARQGSTKENIKESGK